MAPVPDSSVMMAMGEGTSINNVPASTSTPPPTTNKKASCSVKGGSRRVTPKSVRKQKTTPTTATKAEKETPIVPDCFPDHAELSSRMAKNFYYANKLPGTPRPSLPLTKLAVSTFSKTARKDTLEFLDLEKAAEIGRNACVTPTALIMAMVYLERLSVNNPGYLGTVKPSELFVVSLLVASKFMQDDGEELGIFNDEWATSANLELKKLNGLELEFLNAIDWNVKVDPGEYAEVLDRLEKEVSLEEGEGRGWLTYSEAAKLLSLNMMWPMIYHHCIKVITATCLAYTTLLATLVTSSFLAPQIFAVSKSYLTTLTTTQTQPTFLTANRTNFSSSSLGMQDEESAILQDLEETEDLLQTDEGSLINSIHVHNESSVEPNKILDFGRHHFRDNWQNFGHERTLINAMKSISYDYDQDLIQHQHHGNSFNLESLFVGELRNFVETPEKFRVKETCYAYHPEEDKKGFLKKCSNAIDGINFGVGVGKPLIRV